MVFQDLDDPKLIELLVHGAVGVLPTDTIYGLVACAWDVHAVERLYALKHRERKPGTVIAANVEQLIDLGLDPEVVRSVAHLWPNPLSIELQLGEELSHIHQGTGHGAFRVVSDPEVAVLLEQTGPLLTTSANMPGDPPCITVGEAETCFGEQVDFYVDGGNRANRPPSTVVRLEADGTLTMRREGAVRIDKQGNML